MEDHEKAELEQIQQEITLTLQEIDQNFARCVQIVSEGIIPEIDRYKVASQGVWDGLKLWLHLFEQVDRTAVADSTNRPPFNHESAFDSMDPSPWDRLKDKLSPNSHNFGRRAHMLGTATTATSASLAKPHAQALSTYNMDSSSSESTTPSFRRRTSPPKTVPFGLSSSDILKTPAREAALMLVEDTFRRIGANSPPSSGSVEEPCGIAGSDTPASWVNQDRESDREYFEGFMRDRKQKYRQMDLDDELPTIRRPPPRSPGQHYSEEVASFPMFDSTTPVTNYDQDLRPPSKRARQDTQDSLLMSDTRSDQGEEEDNAYEFSQIIPNDLVQDKDGQSVASTPQRSTTSGISVSSSASQLPKQFSLHYFTSMFREPPASTQLTRIYTLFADRPGQPLTVDDLMKLVGDKSFTSDRVKLFVNVLTQKKFTKKDGAGRWILRQ